MTTSCKTITAAAAFCAALSLCSCGMFQEQDTPPPKGTEVWTAKIRGSYQRWQPPAVLPEKAVFQRESIVCSDHDADGGAREPADSSAVLPYRIAGGDTLWGISAKYYGGKGWKWKKIFDANRDRIEDPARLVPGMEILIPSEQEQ